MRIFRMLAILLAFSAGLGLPTVSHSGARNDASAAVLTVCLVARSRLVTPGRR